MAGEEQKAAGVTFSFFITSLAMQASVALGTPSPLTGKSEVHMPQAKMLIDTLVMLKEKAAGNLSAEEDTLIDRCLVELQDVYAQKLREQGAA